MTKKDDEIYRQKLKLEANEREFNRIIEIYKESHIANPKRAAERMYKRALRAVTESEDK